MTILSELYDGDKSHYREDVAHLRPLVLIPHPLRGIEYADGKVSTIAELVAAKKEVKP